MTKGDKAKELFLQGYNCTQAVALAFADELNIDKNTLLMLSSPFGGGMGRLREVCGTVSGMNIVLGLKYGYSTPQAKDEKKALYQDVQALANKFKEDNGSIICRELLGLDIKGGDSPTPSPRTKGYYQKRPCADLCKYAGDLLESYLINH
jgi:C_GCAxxG_C_C family probable redox protein